MRVAVYGSGGVGGFFGGKLAHAGNDVRFIARGDHLRALRDSGLRVTSAQGDFHVASVTATHDPAEAGPVDYVLITVKAYDTDRVAASLVPLLHDDTVVISLQNGIDNEERLGAMAGKHRVAGGVAYIFSTVSRPGAIEHTGGPGTLVLGELDGTGSQRIGRFVEACQAAGIGAEQSSDIMQALWTKFSFICAQAGTTAASGLPVGEILNAPASSELFRRVAGEVCALARAEGFDLPADLPDRQRGFAKERVPGSYSSLHHDLTHARPMELDALLGEVVRRGVQSGVATPVSETLYGVLQPWDRRNRRQE